MMGSCKINKGFEALDSYNYFEAKRYFDKSLKKKESPAAYGLSVIYFRDDNPFHNLDSAYHYSLLSVEALKGTKEKTQRKWKKKLDYSLEKAKLHRKEISDLAYKTAVIDNNVIAYEYFIAKHPWSNHKLAAEKSRDSLAFLHAQKIQTSAAYEEYLKKYVNSEWKHKAQSLLYRAQFDESTTLGNTESYIEFINLFPDNPFVRDAQHQIYSIETKEGTIARYRGFIRRYSDNPFVDEAWTNLYRLSIADYNKESIETFDNEYPDFPFKNLIAQDLKLVGKQLYQFIKNGKYGFMDKEGIVMIAPIYEYAGLFNNGLAVVSKDGLYGYINKDGKQLIDYKYDEAMDFDQGRAIVLENEKYGMIDVSGSYILNPNYIDIGVFSEGKAYAQNKEGYQYYNLDGSIAFPGVFDEAFSFQNGIAQVRKDELKGFIGTNGEFIVSSKEGSFSHFKDSIFVHEFRDSMNFMYANGKYLFNNGFDKIGVLINNRAIIEKAGKYGYVNGKGNIVIPMTHTPYSNYMQFSQFENGYAVLKRGNNLALMDSLGKSVYPAIFSGIGAYGELTPVSKGQGWGYANKDVQLKINYQYEYAFEFVKGNAIVERDDRLGLINAKNEVIVPLVYESIKRLENDVLLVKSNNFHGLLSTANDTIIEAKYDRILQLSPSVYQLIKGQDITYFDAKKNNIISLRE